MKTLTVLCNVLLACFTCFVVATEGYSHEAVYIVFSLLLVLVPLFTVFVLVRTRPSQEARSNARVVVTLCNILLLGLVCWAIVDQYPHPAEAGVIEFEVLAVLTPILSVVALLRGRRIRSRIEPVRLG